MRFMLTMYASPRVPRAPRQAESTDWMRDMIAFMTRIDDDLRASGELVADAGFNEPGFTVTSTERRQEPLADGSPLIGFWLVDVASEDRAIEIARELADWAGAVEVRRTGEPPAV